MAIETELTFGSDSVASQVESKWRDEVILYYNNTESYTKYLKLDDQSKVRKFVDLSLPQNATAKGLFVDDLNKLLVWAGIPRQRYEELIR